LFCQVNETRVFSDSQATNIILSSSGEITLLVIRAHELQSVGTNRFHDVARTELQSANNSSASGVAGAASEPLPSVPQPSTQQSPLPSNEAIFRPPARRHIETSEPWGPWGFLFPKAWAKVWVGYVLLGLIIPSICKVLDLVLLDYILGTNLGLHVLLMPFVFHRKHQGILNAAVAHDLERPAELDPNAKTVLWAISTPCGEKIIDAVFGTVSNILWLFSWFGIDMQAFWFPAPFYDFHKVCDPCLNNHTCADSVWLTRACTCTGQRG